MKRRLSLRNVTMGLVALLLLAQLVRPARTNPPVDPARTIQAATAMTPEISSILARSCRDCHSYDTVWPWYSQIAPVSWLLVSHVNEGRQHVSFSTWADYTTEEASERLDEMCAEVREGDMPMSSYVVGHADAALTDADKAALCTWTERERARLAGRSARQRTASTTLPITAPLSSRR
jgi:hypothetical protein